MVPEVGRPAREWVDLDGSAPALRALRAEARRHLAASGVAAPVVGDALVVLSELVRNGLAASGGRPLSCSVSVTDAVVAVEVTNPWAHARAVPDFGPGVGAPGDPVAGFGLPVVSVLAVRLRVDLGEGYTVVRAELLR